GAQDDAPALSQGAGTRASERSVRSAGPRALWRLGHRSHPGIPAHANEGHETYGPHSDGGGTPQGCAPLSRPRHLLSTGVTEVLPSILEDFLSGPLAAGDLAHGRWRGLSRRG